MVVRGEHHGGAPEPACGAVGDDAAIRHHELEHLDAKGERVLERGHDVDRSHRMVDQTGRDECAEVLEPASQLARLGSGERPVGGQYEERSDEGLGKALQGGDSNHDSTVPRTLT